MHEAAGEAVEATVGWGLICMFAISSHLNWLYKIICFQKLLFLTFIYQQEKAVKKSRKRAKKDKKAKAVEEIDVKDVTMESEVWELYGQTISYLY